MAPKKSSARGSAKTERGRSKRCPMSGETPYQKFQDYTDREDFGAVESGAIEDEFDVRDFLLSEEGFPAILEENWPDEYGDQ